jgi:hypothetical protein
VTTLTRDDGTYVFPNPRIVLEWAWERYSKFNEALTDHSSNLYLGTTFAHALSHNMGIP